MLITSMMRVILTRSLKPFVFKGRYDNVLEYRDLDSLGLYVHIPFCRSLCSFCPYCKVQYDEALAKAYEIALLREIELCAESGKSCEAECSKAAQGKGVYAEVAQVEATQSEGAQFQAIQSKSAHAKTAHCETGEDISTDYKQTIATGIIEKKTVTSLYFGGGTPVLMIDSLGKIIEKLKLYFTIEGEIGVELHPSDIEPGNLEKLKEAGVTMVSMGVQSFNSECLTKIGRSAENIEAKLALIKKYDFSVVDIDLIFGIPGQDKDILKKDVEMAFSLGATQISTYPFIDFTYANNQYKPLSHKTKKQMLGYLNELCREMDIDRTSVWTFAKKKTGRYSSITRDNFLGFGVSATTLLRNQFKINTFSIEEYVNRIHEGNLATSLTLDFSKRQRALYYLFWGAYGLVIDPVGFENLIGTPLNKLYGVEIWIALKLGLLKKHNNKYELTEKGAFYYHFIEQQYTRAYIDKMWNISMKTAFPDEVILK